MSTERPLEVSPQAFPPADSVLDDDLLTVLRSFGVTAALIHDPRGLILEGVSHTYYGKQMAQELLRKANMVVVSNRIRVDRV